MKTSLTQADIIYVEWIGSIMILQWMAHDVWAQVL